MLNTFQCFAHLWQISPQRRATLEEEKAWSNGRPAKRYTLISWPSSMVKFHVSHRKRCPPERGRNLSPRRVAPCHSWIKRRTLERIKWTRPKSDMVGKKRGWYVLSRGTPVLKTRIKVTRNEPSDYIVAPNVVVCRRQCKKSHEEGRAASGSSTGTA